MPEETMTTEQKVARAEQIALRLMAYPRLHLHPHLYKSGTSPVVTPAPKPAESVITAPEKKTPEPVPYERFADVNNDKKAGTGASSTLTSWLNPVTPMLRNCQPN